MKNSGNRTKKIDARFTEDEYKLILEMEQALGIRKTDLVRNGLLGNAKKTVINARELIAQLHETGTALGRSGNNINQLARYANQLVKKEILSPVVAERFNILMQEYLVNQKDMETTLRRIMRTMG